MEIYKRVFKNLALILLGLTLFVLLLDSYGPDSTTFFILVIIAAAICILIMFLYLRSILKPLETITLHLQQIAAGKLTELSEITRTEFVQAFRNLNIIVHRLHKYERKLSQQKEGFNLIIESLKEAIWIQNKQGIITTSNQSFDHLTGHAQPKDQYFWNVIRSRELYDVADRIFRNPVSSTEDIRIESRHFLCSTSYSALTEETIFILYDITDIRKLETIKKDFILNVSHELRTPLTSIKGYLETFGSELTNSQKEFVDVIRRNTDRLIRIVNDLLTLSRLEYDRSIELENIVIKDMLQNLSYVFGQRLQSKGLRLSTEINTGKAYFQADRFKFEQALINLVDNAVKYTEKGEIKITVQEAGKNFVFRISDTGIGIGEEHLPRLFERFYVVDKSRSRRLGGTGLGLSIVKHIVSLHEGSIDVESSIGAGTTFIIAIPQK